MKVSWKEVPQWVSMRQWRHFLETPPDSARADTMRWFTTCGPGIAISVGVGARDCVTHCHRKYWRYCVPRQRVEVSGQTYDAALDLEETTAAKDGLIPTEKRRRGRGYRYVYMVTARQRESLLRRLHSIGGVMSHSSDAKEHAMGLACMRDWVRLSGEGKDNARSDRRRED